MGQVFSKRNHCIYKVCYDNECCFDGGCCFGIVRGDGGSGGGESGCGCVGGGDESDIEIIRIPTSNNTYHEEYVAFI